MEKSYGFSLQKTKEIKGLEFKKSSNEDSKELFSFFFEEEDISETEDDSILETSIDWGYTSLFDFKFYIKKVQFSIYENFLYFQSYSQPLFIIFRNLRL
ncbi:MAG: hypothetical protein RJA76_203 [Bacteroidota bacterium]|jgi:hypothetical protein